MVQEVFYWILKTPRVRRTVLANTDCPWDWAGTRRLYGDSILRWDKGLCWQMWIVLGTRMVQSTMLFSFDCSWDRADRKDSVVRCKSTLGVGWCDELAGLKGTAVGTVLVQRTVLANVDRRSGFAGYVDCRLDCVDWCGVVLVLGWYKGQCLLRWIVLGTGLWHCILLGNAVCQWDFSGTLCGQFWTNMKITNGRLSVDVSECRNESPGRWELRAVGGGGGRWKRGCLGGTRFL